MSKASVADMNGNPLRVAKGAFATASSLVRALPTAGPVVNALELRGFRVLAVAMEQPEALRLIGAIALTDPPREDSESVVTELHALGGKIVMLSGDAPITALAGARSVSNRGGSAPAAFQLGNLPLETFAVFTGVLPEDKFKLVGGLPGRRPDGGHVRGWGQRRPRASTSADRNRCRHRNGYRQIGGGHGAH